MKIEQRDEEIWRLRKEGNSFSEIAGRFGITSSRAQQICRRKKEMIDNFDKWPPLKRLLSVRIRNILIKAFRSEEIFKNPDKLAAMGPNIFLQWRNMGRKSLKELCDALESLGYPVNAESTMTDPRCEIYLGVGKSILRDYFEHNTKNPADDTEYIPIVRLIIEGVAKEMKASGIGEQNCNKLMEKLKSFNRQMYQTLWMRHAKEDADAAEEPLDIEKELKTAGYTFNYIYRHGKHPK